jgi:peptide chain release factor 3
VPPALAADFTFVNKLDRPGRAPLELIDEVERELGLAVYAVNWPVGAGEDFQGVYDRRAKLLHLYERRQQGSKQAAETTIALDDPRLETIVPAALLRQLKEDLEILDGVGAAFDQAAVDSGNLTPVFSAARLPTSASNNFYNPSLNTPCRPARMRAASEKSSRLIRNSPASF